MCERWEKMCERWGFEHEREEKLQVAGFRLQELDSYFGGLGFKVQ